MTRNVSHFPLIQLCALPVLLGLACETSQTPAGAATSATQGPMPTGSTSGTREVNTAPGRSQPGMESGGAGIGVADAAGSIQGPAPNSSAAGGATSGNGGVNSAFESGGTTNAEQESPNEAALTDAAAASPSTGSQSTGVPATEPVDAGASTQGTFQAAVKPRVLVLTDISNEPDDEESLVRLLVYANEYDIAGLVATTSTHLHSGTREDLIRAQLDAYEEVRSNLTLHADGFPSADTLRAVTATGQDSYGMAAVGAGNDTSGSNLLIEAVDNGDERPLWIAGWGGMSTLAQALSSVRDSRSEAELSAFVSKLRIYAISDQDDAGIWLRREFPSLFYIVTPSDQTADDYYKATWTGISGDEHYNNGPGYHLDLVSNEWLSENVRVGHGALGMLYPAWKYIMEGDTPSFLGLIDNGLGWSLNPGYGGWGGRYLVSQPAGEPREIWTNSEDTFEYAMGSVDTSAQATIWRWRPDFQYDFAARMDWCVASSYEQANHNPVPALSRDVSKAVQYLRVSAGQSVTLSAQGTQDPDGDAFDVRWYVYPEAGTFEADVTLSVSEAETTELQLPEDAEGSLHVILDVRDHGDPPLSAYRRVVIDVAK